MSRTEHFDGPDLGTDHMAIVSAAELHLLVSDFESLVAAGVILGTRQEASQFFSGWLAFADQRRHEADGRFDESLPRTSALSQKNR